MAQFGVQIFAPRVRRLVVRLGRHRRIFRRAKKGSVFIICVAQGASHLFLRFHTRVFLNGHPVCALCWWPEFLHILPFESRKCLGGTRCLLAIRNVVACPLSGVCVRNPLFKSGGAESLGGFFVPNGLGTVDDCAVLHQKVIAVEIRHVGCHLVELRLGHPALYSGLSLCGGPSR